MQKMKLSFVSFSEFIISVSEVSQSDQFYRVELHN